MNKNVGRKTLASAFKASLPVMAGYIVLGIGFGILMASHGYAWYWSFFMSLFVFAGSMQYVAVDLLAGGASLVTFAIMTLVVNARHIFYGLSMLSGYRDMGAAKPYLIFSLTDETFSIVANPSVPKDIPFKHYSLLVSILDQSYWVIGSTIGAIVGSALSFNSGGVEFSMTALFTVTMIEQWEKTKNHLPALTGILVSVVCLLIFGPSNFLIPAMIGIMVLLIIEKRLMTKMFGEGCGMEDKDV